MSSRSSSHGDDAVICDMSGASAVVSCWGTCECVPSSGATSGSITDGSGDYSNNEDCRWLIASAGSISLSFTSFNTESNYDYVTINRCQDSSCSSPDPVARLSGDSVSASSTYTSSTGYLQVVFTSDGSVTRSGFVATWNTQGGDTQGGALTCTNCGAGKYSPTVGEFASMSLCSYHSSGRRHADGHDSTEIDRVVT